MKKTRVIVTGATGRMGQAVINGILDDPQCSLVGAVDIKGEGKDIGAVLGRGNLGIRIEQNLEKVIEDTLPDVMVDFTIAQVAKTNIDTAIKFGVYSVVGTTGFNEKELEEIQGLSEDKGTGVFFAPNFAIGAVLMMQCAKEIIKYLPEAEIIELHHDQKLDSPSGTALRTAEIMALERGLNSNTAQGKEKKGMYEKVKGARGGNHNGIPIHSIRLPGLVAHQEIIFGGLGQTLSIRHDSIDRNSFIPGVLLAIKEAPKREGVVVGLENLMEM
ncbi:MAG: 4-hydroxy-tetrahydrodipicolinate reductase [Clostridia bacterium]|nr:4-hydroxy-tetrahydrodipicolinate reductase [Clostridia bacterium]